MKILTKVEEFILLAIWSLEGEAYSLAIQQFIAEQANESWSLGTIYAPLARLEKRKYIRSVLTAPRAEKGGRQKRVYLITEAGKEALMEARRTQNTLWGQIPGVSGSVNP